MPLTRIQIARADIVRHFDELPQKIFKLSEISHILTAQREFWRLAQRTNTDEFIHFLQKSGRLKHLQFKFPTRPEQVYVWNEAPLLEILMSLKPNSYFSHYTAMKYHGLTLQTPKTLYITHEQTGAGARGGTLTQDAIDGAFRKPTRVSNNMVEHDDLRICMLNGANTGDLGVIEGQMSYDTSESAKVRVTNLERTLIDLTVRPIYSGGVAEVLAAFEQAQPLVSVNRMRAMLQDLHYAYPYRQAIGFYLERTGYKKPQVELFSSTPQEFDFYLTHDMRQTEYVPRWRLHVPKGL